MLSAYVPTGTSLEQKIIEPGQDVPEAAVWIDLVTPTPGEDKLVERLVGVAIPTREEMQEIELSSRLYVENGARYMTATLMCQSDTPIPKTTPVTFILAGHRLITVRYDEPKPFAVARHKLTRYCPATVSGETVFIDLLDAVVDRCADILERVGVEIDQVSHNIFERDRARTPKFYTVLLQTIGRKGELASKVRESLVSIGRLLIFVANEAEGHALGQGAARAAEIDAARRAIAVRPRHLSRQQRHLPARRHARRGHDRAEQHHQDFLGRGGGVHAADLDRLDLRHEFQAHAGARLAVWLSGRDRLDDHRRRSCRSSISNGASGCDGFAAVSPTWVGDAAEAICSMPRTPGGGIEAACSHSPIQLSNSQASSFSLRKSARASDLSFRFAPSKRGSGAPYGARVRALARSTGPSLRSRPRLTALHCGVLNPWCPTSFLAGFRRGGRLRDIDPGPHNGPGGCPPRTPGTAVCETAGAGAAPHPRSVSLGRAPLCG